MTDISEQLLVAEKKLEDYEFFGVCLFGSVEKIQPFTKKFSLWK